MLPKSYKVAKWFAIADYIAIPFSFGFGLFSSYSVFMELRERAFVLAFFIFLFAIFWFLCSIYSISILPRFKEIITISDEQIIQERPGEFSTSIRWDEEFTIRDRLILGRLELSSQDGSRMIRLEHQLDGYKEIVGVISRKLIDKHDTENLAEIPPYQIPSEKSDRITHISIQ